MFLRKSRSIEALHAKARKDDDAVSLTSKKSARSLLPKRSLRFLRGRRSEHEPMPANSADTSLASAPDLSPVPTGERPNAGLGILNPGDTALPGGPAAQPLSNAAFFSETRVAGLGMRLPPQHRLGGTPELPQTPNQAQDPLVEQGGTQSGSPGVDLHSLRFQSPNAYAAGRSALANPSSPARLYKPPQQTEPPTSAATTSMPSVGQGAAVTAAPTSTPPATSAPASAPAAVSAPDATTQAQQQYSNAMRAQMQSGAPHSDASEPSSHVWIAQGRTSMETDLQHTAAAPAVMTMPTAATVPAVPVTTQAAPSVAATPPRDAAAPSAPVPAVPVRHSTPPQAAGPRQASTPVVGPARTSSDAKGPHSAYPVWYEGRAQTPAAPVSMPDEAELVASERAAHSGVPMPQLHIARLGELGAPVDPDASQSSASMRGVALGSGPPSAAPPVVVVSADNMLGTSLLLYDDASVANARDAAGTAVAWTYDDWFLSSSAPWVSPGEDITAVVGSLREPPPDGAAAQHTLALAVFCSALRPAADGSRVYDVASRVPREPGEAASLADADAAAGVQPVTTRARNAALFAPNRHVVLAATPRRLVAEMTSGSSPGLMEDVLVAYRTYFNAQRLQDLLFSRADWAVRKLAQAPVRATAARVLRSTQHALAHWFEHYYAEDYAPDASLEERLVEFAMQHAQRAAHLDLAGSDVEVRDGAVALWHLVQARARPELLPSSTAPDAAPLRSSPSLHKVRSLTRLWGRERKDDAPTSAPTSRTRKGSVRGASHMRVASNASAASLSSSPHGHARKASGGASLWESPVSKAESVLRRGRRSLRRRARADDAEADASDGEGELLVADEAETAGPAEHDAALAQLEAHLDGRPVGGEVQRARDGPIQWIPEHANASWRDAQRLSVHAAARPDTTPTLPAGWAQRGTLLLTQRSETIARQLTALEKQLLSLVHWTELADLSWDHHAVQQEQRQREYQEYVTWRISHAGAAAPEARAPVPKQAATHLLVARFNRACAWVASHIVTTRDAEERAAVVCKWIRIAWDCYMLGNHATLCQILFGLQSPWVARLEATWRSVGAWEMRVFDALRRFTSPRDQFSQLRQATLATLAGHSEGIRVYVPFLGTFVSDLSTNDALALYIETNLQPSMVPFYDDQELSQSWDTLLNLYRLRIKAMIVRDFQALQEHAARIPDVAMELPLLAEALQLDTLPAAQIQSASLALEP
ncbi:Guanine nucleotide exchange factor lte1 [Malassezia brasiliensis]|uniref:Guanine nucleotide exchange factor lte1 n=1 Tax=Malassezia brasiliensis TaxID=1821822 RepID=A0AAF0IPT9_9BASI|nr:Guanine nucleotide exchange factor lte1 [Malassezia brasiliensis]